MTQCRHSHLALLKMLNKDGKINDAIIENMLSWRHSGFHVYLGPTIWPDDEKALENLARYITRACFSTATHGLHPQRRCIGRNCQIHLHLEGPINKSRSTWQRRVNRPPFEILKAEIEQSGFTAVGRKYGVSDNAVRKWMKAYSEPKV